MMTWGGQGIGGGEGLRQEREDFKAVGMATVWQANHGNDGQNYRVLLIPVILCFIPGEKPGLLRCLEEKNTTLTPLSWLLFSSAFPLVLLLYAHVMLLL